MTFEKLISLCRPVTITAVEKPVIQSLQQDSRRISDNDVFIAVRGYKTDGHRFIHDAITNGASVIICEEPFKTDKKDVTVLQVAETRPLLGTLSQEFQGNPQQHLKIIGVTGTNGKTTVSTLIWQILNGHGVNAAMLGTTGKYFQDEVTRNNLTTTEPIELASDMRTLTDRGCTHLVMEVSSHALDQERTSGIRFTGGIFTNLSHDHLDYHKDLDSYLFAKKKLFDGLHDDAWAVINRDDPSGQTIQKDCKANIIDFSFEYTASIRCEIIASDEKGMAIRIDDTDIRTPLIGKYNAYNVTEAFLACQALGLDQAETVEIMQQCGGAPGRLEKVTATKEANNLPVVVVDYAHTPDALKNVAETLSQLRNENQKLIIVFGCGGDRDRSKRPQMAAVAERYADSIIVTSDNPRSEDPVKIIGDISRGFKTDHSWTAIEARKEAITRTIRTAPANAIILIAGKGHETYQEIKGKRHHFDDREIARIALDQRIENNSSSEVV